MIGKDEATGIEYDFRMPELFWFRLLTWKRLRFL